MRRTVTILTGLVIAATLTVKAFYRAAAAEAPVITTEAVTRGSVVNTVAATGTLEAVTTVQVGSQVSGSIEALYADFNSMVKKGQVLARLDQSTYATAVDQAQASTARRLLAQRQLRGLGSVSEPDRVGRQSRRDPFR